MLREEAKDWRGAMVSGGKNGDGEWMFVLTILAVSPRPLRSIWDQNKKENFYAL